MNWRGARTRQEGHMKTILVNSVKKWWRPEIRLWVLGKLARCSSDKIIPGTTPSLEGDVSSAKYLLNVNNILWSVLMSALCPTFLPSLLLRNRSFSLQRLARNGKGKQRQRFLKTFHSLRSDGQRRPEQVKPTSQQAYWRDGYEGGLGRKN